MRLNKFAILLLIYSLQIFAQQTPLNPAIPNSAVDKNEKNQKTAGPATSSNDEDNEKPNGRRIRRHLNLIIGVEHDEELGTIRGPQGVRRVVDREIRAQAAGTVDLADEFAHVRSPPTADLTPHLHRLRLGRRRIA